MSLARSQSADLKYSSDTIEWERKVLLNVTGEKAKEYLKKLGIQIDGRWRDLRAKPAKLMLLNVVQKNPHMRDMITVQGVEAVKPVDYLDFLSGLGPLESTSLFPMSKFDGVFESDSGIIAYIYNLDSSSVFAGKFQSPLRAALFVNEYCRQVGYPPQCPNATVIVSNDDEEETTSVMTSKRRRNSGLSGKVIRFIESLSSPRNQKTKETIENEEEVDGI